MWVEGVGGRGGLPAALAVGPSHSAVPSAQPVPPPRRDGRSFGASVLQRGKDQVLPGEPGDVKEVKCVSVCMYWSS